jgi:hypothetical protein
VKIQIKSTRFSFPLDFFEASITHSEKQLWEIHKEYIIEQQNKLMIERIKNAISKSSGNYTTSN